MPSLQQNAAMLSSPRRPCSAMEILSSAERGRRVWCRVSFMTVSTGVLAGEFSEEGLSFLFVPSSLRRNPNPPQFTTQIFTIGDNG